MDSQGKFGMQSKPDVVDDPAEIVALLLHAATYVRIRFGEFLAEFGLTEGRYAVLAALRAAGTEGLSQSDVAEKLMHSESNVSSLVDRLHHDGLIDRRWSDTDRRKRVLILSGAGLELMDRIEAARRIWSSRIMKSASVHDRAVLIDMLRGLGGDQNQPPVRRTGQTSLGRIAETPGIVPPWQSHPAQIPGDPSSPHFALERMLSSLGLLSRRSSENYQ